MDGRKKWRELSKERKQSPEYQAAYEHTRKHYEIGKKVRALREEHGLTQAELAQRMGSTQSVIARLELGGAEPRFDLLERVGKALDSELTVEFRPHQAAAPAERGGRAATSA